MQRVSYEVVDASCQTDPVHIYDAEKSNTADQGVQWEDLKYEPDIELVEEQVQYEEPTILINLGPVSLKYSRLRSPCILMVFLGVRSLVKRAPG